MQNEWFLLAIIPHIYLDEIISPIFGHKLNQFPNKKNSDKTNLELLKLHSMFSFMILCNLMLPATALIGVGGAIFDTFSRFENSVESVVSVVGNALLFVSRLIFCVVVFDRIEPAVELPFVGIRNLLFGAGKIFEPCTRFTCRIIPSGAII